jgi:chemotaxis protein methyltransferase CheR
LIPPPADPGRLSDACFEQLKEAVYRYCGVRVREELRPTVERKLRQRLLALRLGSFEAYCERLAGQHGPQELAAAAELLTSHQTYFFREPRQLATFAQALLPRLSEARARERHLRVWSAGCASGEEAYTLAMLLDASGLFAGWSLEVYGTDLSEEMIARARRAEYPLGALRDAPPQWQGRYFDALGARLRVRDELREQVSFQVLNLIDPDARLLMPAMDAIFCRNVLIYLDPPARRQVISLLHHRLVPGGYLLLGHSENLFNLDSGLEWVRVGEDLVYRKPGAPEVTR